MTENVRIDVVGDPEFFSAVAEHATRLDRSSSWVLQRCLRAALPKLALRNPIRLMSNLAIAKSADPAVRASARCA